MPILSVTMKRLSVKKVKTFRGNEGVGFNADLYVDGVRFGMVIDSANGGCYDYEFETREKETQFNAIIEEIRKETGDDAFEYSDRVVGELVDEFENLKLLKRKMKKVICYRTAKCKPNEYFICKTEPTPVNIAALRARHPVEGIVVLNEKQDFEIMPIIRGVGL